MGDVRDPAELGASGRSGWRLRLAKLQKNLLHQVLSVFECISIVTVLVASSCQFLGLHIQILSTASNIWAR